MTAEPALAIPTTAEGLTPAFLTSVLRTCHPGVTVEGFTLSEIRRFGEVMVSTSDRVRMELHYAAGTGEGLPTRVVAKTTRTGGSNLGELYDNEVNFYVRLRPELAIEAPRVLGGISDKGEAAYYLLLEDLSLRHAVFPTVLRNNSLDEVRSILDQFALLHATFWNSPRLTGDLAWYQGHASGSLAERELLAGLGTTAERLHAGYLALMHHQSTLPQTIVHGDGHIGNTYLLPGGKAGLLDFQLTSRGAWCHDVSYLLATALPIAVRRQEERALLAYYLDRLAAHGVAEVPLAETTWLELGRAFLWGLYIGWLPTPIGNYGEDINVENLKRTAAAFADHRTGELVDALL
jgi:hypothetical protein